LKFGESEKKSVSAAIKNKSIDSNSMIIGSKLDQLRVSYLFQSLKISTLLSQYKKMSKKCKKLFESKG